MSTKRYTQEFKVEAVGQVVEKVYRVADVAARLGVRTRDRMSSTTQSCSTTPRGVTRRSPACRR